MESEYMVIHLIGETYQVVYAQCEYDCDNVLYQGNLSDCESWIRLKQNGLLR